MEQKKNIWNSKRWARITFERLNIWICWDKISWHWLVIKWALTIQTSCSIVYRVVIKVYWKYSADLRCFGISWADWIWFYSWSRW